jgi:ribosomal protein S17E
MILLTIVYLYPNSSKAFFTKIFMIKAYSIKKSGSMILINKHWLILLIFCCASNLSAIASTSILFKTSGQEPIKKIVKEIAKSNVYVYADGVPESGKIPDQEIRYRELLKIAGADDLIGLAKDKNAVVRLYAYKAIVRQFSKIPTDLFEQFSNDKTIVTTLRGKVEEKTTINKIAGSLLY